MSLENRAILRLPVAPAEKKEWPWNYEAEQFPAKMPNNGPWPRISIIMPSYNQGQYLEEAIRSVLLQGYPNLDFIIIDGGSTDGSVEIIKRYVPWVTYWESESDRGQSHAINKGFARATGSIMAWLNSDDVYAPGALAHVAQALAAKERTLLVGASIITDGPDLLEGNYDDRFPSWEEMVYEARTYPQPSVFWTADLWAEGGPLDEHMYFAMDYALWLRMHQQARDVVHEKKVLSFARTHEEQKSYVEEDEEARQRFRKARVEACLIEAQRRGEPPLLWLWRAWKWRWVNALQKRQWNQLRGSIFLRVAMRETAQWYLKRLQAS